MGNALGHDELSVDGRVVRLGPHERCQHTGQEHLLEAPVDEEGRLRLGHGHVEVQQDLAQPLIVGPAGCRPLTASDRLSKGRERRMKSSPWGKNVVAF